MNFSSIINNKLYANYKFNGCTLNVQRGTCFFEVWNIFKPYHQTDDRTYIYPPISVQYTCSNDSQKNVSYIIEIYVNRQPYGQFLIYNVCAAATQDNRNNQLSWHEEDTNKIKSTFVRIISNFINLIILENNTISDHLLMKKYIYVNSYKLINLLTKTQEYDPLRTDWYFSTIATFIKSNWTSYTEQMVNQYIDRLVVADKYGWRPETHTLFNHKSKERIITLVTIYTTRSNSTAIAFKNIPLEILTEIFSYIIDI